MANCRSPVALQERARIGGVGRRSPDLGRVANRRIYRALPDVSLPMPDLTPGPLDLAFAPSVDHRGQPSLLRRAVSARRSCTVGGEGKGTGETRLCLVT